MLRVVDFANVADIELIYLLQILVFSLKLSNAILKWLDIEFNSPFFILFLTLHIHGLLLLDSFIFSLFQGSIITFIALFYLLRVERHIIILCIFRFTLHVEPIEGDIFFVLQGLKKMIEIFIVEKLDKRDWWHILFLHVWTYYGFYIKCVIRTSLRIKIINLQIFANEIKR
jgi:hypothetical protein